MLAFSGRQDEADPTRIETILGRRRPINGIKNTTGRIRNPAERFAINTVIQGSAADLIKLAMLNVFRRLKGEKARARLLLQIHDELVLEVPPDDLGAVAADEQTAEFVGVDVGAPLVWLEDVIEDENGQPRALAQLRLRGDRIAFSANAYRSA